MIAFSGYHSKDAIVATAMTFADLNRTHFLLFYVPLLGAGITAFYMFRLWFYTFAGEPRDQHVYEHAHESPWVMTIPLIVLSVFAAFVRDGGGQGPACINCWPPANRRGSPRGFGASEAGAISLPGHEAIHAKHTAAGAYALIVAILGALTAYVFYGARRLDPGEVRRQFAALHTFLVEKWWFDEMYDVMFVRPVHIVARWCAAIDRNVFDGFLHFMARGAVAVSKLGPGLRRTDHRRVRQSAGRRHVCHRADFRFPADRPAQAVRHVHRRRRHRDLRAVAGARTLVRRCLQAAAQVIVQIENCVLEIQLGRVIDT